MSMAILLVCLYNEVLNSKGILINKKDISEKLGIKDHTIRRAERIINNSNINNNLVFYMPDDEKIIMSASHRLEIPLYNLELACKINKNIKKLNLVHSFDPNVSLAVSIFAAQKYLNDDTKRKKIAIYFNISEICILKHYNNIDKYIYLLANDELPEKFLELLVKEINSIKN